MANPRTAEVKRITNETKIDVSINLDSYPGNTFGVKQEISVSTGIGFLDHVRDFTLVDREKIRGDVYAELSSLSAVSPAAGVDVPCPG